mmetsp:Transcript_6172/g.10753  ORF Transcript_6172/g.10753 Transcript_6172/m.10753 type:complete len:172 (-) Transcript_6172:81-596(-)|eukprot:CAMPEP_0116547094 /NCGR_PEP_ID=MMETSP0397-20121206/3590_1 /TAXON_ID=216820 /ORGANISM="Cyclophora tenuis, Strain ECT3854" /LENGTH=171 /DNA_ID=CAMNT_0004071595 /DNA_START=40 /DNA_END=555 /DNA_ORIENTATION=+
MSLRLTSRRVVRHLAHRDIDWSSPVFRGNQQLASLVNQFRSWVASAETMAEKYNSPPEPIDFAGAKDSVRDKDLIDELEKLYGSSSPPPEVHEWTAEDKAQKLQQIEDVKTDLALTEELIADTEKEIAFLKANMTTRDTSVADLAEVYPDIAEEIEDEIEKREWFKDTIAK